MDSSSTHLRDLVRDAAQRELVDEDGEPVTLELLPGLLESELVGFEATLPCAVPADVRDLLLSSRGIDGIVDVLDFTGRALEFEAPEVFPHGLPIAHDGFGNYWVVDLAPSSKTFGPIYFACHDAPVVLYQSPDLEHFLVELFEMVTPPHRSAVNGVHDDELFDVWRKNPGVRSHEECLASGDEALRAFAEELGPSFEIIDLRRAEIGFGFSWGRYGPNTVVRRFGHEPIFAYERRPSFWRRLLGRAG